MSKPRSDAKLLNLPEEQQAELAGWLLSGTPYHAARELCIKQFGVTASLRAFSDFWVAVCQPAILSRRRKAVMTSEELAEEAEKEPGRFDAATLDAIKQRAFELSINPGCNPKDVKNLFSLLLKARDQELDQSQLALDRQKFQFDAAKAALAAASELKAIVADSGLSESEKIDKARLQLFGSLAE